MAAFRRREPPFSLRDGCHPHANLPLSQHLELQQNTHHSNHNVKCIGSQKHDRINRRMTAGTPTAEGTKGPTQTHLLSSLLSPQNSRNFLASGPFSAGGPLSTSRPANVASTMRPTVNRGRPFRFPCPDLPPTPAGGGDRGLHPLGPGIPDEAYKGFGGTGGLRPCGCQTFDPMPKRYME